MNGAVDDHVARLRQCSLRSPGRPARRPQDLRRKHADGDGAASRSVTARLAARDGVARPGRSARAAIRCCSRPAKPPMAARHLVDRQHPHDLLMELSASYSAQARRRQQRFQIRRLAGRAGARADRVHAPFVGHGQSGGAAHAPLARLDPHHLRRRHRRLRLAGDPETGSLRRSTAGSRTSIAGTWKCASSIPPRRACRGIRRRSGPCR